MRKAGMFFLAVFMVVSIGLNGCANNERDSELLSMLPQHVEKSLVALEISAVGDACDSGVHSSDYDLWSYENCSFHKEESALQTMEVLFGGAEYKGVYDCSYVELHNTYTTHRYNMEDGWFAVNGDTGELVGFMFYDLETGDLEREDCAAVARKFAATLVDINQYQFSESFEESFYTCSYVRFLNGVETSERIDISVSTTGRITSFYSKMLGAFARVEEEDRVQQEKKLTSLVSAEAEKLVSEKIDKIYSSESRQHAVEKRKYVLLPDGNIAMVYDVGTKDSTDIGDGLMAVSTSLVQILVKYE